MNASTGKQVARPPFDPDVFVGHADEKIGRSPEVNLILGKVKQLCNGDPIEKRVTVFSGEAALGKTWLLRQIENELTMGTDPCFRHVKTYRLDPPDRSHIEDDFDATREVKKILEAFAQGVLGEPIKEITLPELSRHVMDSTKKVLDYSFLVLFVDAVFEADWNFLELFEEHLLGPLAIIPNVLIVLSGRGRKFPWATPELRFRADFRDLQPFTLDDTRMQIERLKRPDLTTSERIDLIQEIGQGVPGATGWLVKDSEFLKNQNPATLDAILNHLLESVPEADRTKIRRNIEALCVLRAFDDDRVSKLVQVYEEATEGSPDSFPLTHGASVNIQKTLVQEAFAQYQNALGAYTLDKYVAKLAEEYLKRQNPVLWRNLHTTAMNLYAEWEVKYERTKDRWVEEKSYHEGVLTSASAV